MVLPQRPPALIAAPKRPIPWKKAAVWAIFLLVCVVAFDAGVRFRRWTWDYTKPIHFRNDIDNGYRWGTRGAAEGYLSLYDNVAWQSGGAEDEKDYGLDYAPLRLLLMTRWVQWTHETFPKDRVWRPEYEFTAPLLRFNTAIALASAIAAFLLVRHWARREQIPPPPSRWWSRIRQLVGRPSQALPLSGQPQMPVHAPFCGWGRGLIAALLIWFSPAMVLSSHGWPTWDTWVIPFYLFAVLLACLDWWFCAGVVLAIGAMFKGQQLFVAAVFVAWPLLNLRPGAAVRWIAGFAFAAAIVVSPWMLRETITEHSNREAIRWVGGVLIGCGLLGIRHAARRGKWYWWLAPTAIAAFLFTWPWFQLAHREHWLPGIALAAIAIAAAWWLPARRQPMVVAGALAGALFLCIPLYDASTNWFNIGFAYGTRHYQGMTMGFSSNLPAILSARYGWDSFQYGGLQNLIWTIAPNAFWIWPTEVVQVPIRDALFRIFLVTFILCCIGVAVHSRRNDPRFLVAISAPWLMFFCIPTQIHERYLLYAAAISAVTVGVNSGLALLHLFLTAVTCVMTLNVMLRTESRYIGFARDIAPDFGARLYRWVQVTHPDIGWAVLLSGAIFLYLTLAPGRRLIRRTATSLAAASRPAPPAPAAPAALPPPPVAGTLSTPG